MKGSSSETSFLPLIGLNELIDLATTEGEVNCTGPASPSPKLFEKTRKVTIGFVGGRRSQLVATGKVDGGPFDPKILCLLPGLVAPQHPGSNLPMQHALTAPATPVHGWPERREPLEGDHPGHGEGFR
jgi:hypothetical protein